MLALLCAGHAASRSVRYLTSRPGAKEGGKSLLGRDEPSRWYEAADALPPLPASDAAAAPPDDEAVEAARAQADAALEVSTVRHSSRVAVHLLQRACVPYTLHDNVALLR